MCQSYVENACAFSWHTCGIPVVQKAVVIACHLVLDPSVDSHLTDTVIDNLLYLLLEMFQAYPSLVLFCFITHLEL